MKIAILGGGPAGVFTARKLKALDPAVSVCLYGLETDGFTMKIRLPEYIAGSLDRAKLILASREKLLSEGIDCPENSIAESVCPERMTVHTRNGGSEAFDAIVFATGAEASLPPVPGLAETPGVLTLRRLADAEAMVRAASAGKRALVLGGGLIGLELAYAFRKRGMEVVVLEALDRLLARCFSPAQSSALEALLAEHGIIVSTGVRTERIQSCADGAGVRVETESGAVYDGAFLAVSAGIRSNTTAAIASGLQCGRGICVSNRLETSAKNIYAVGDCAEQNGATGGLWTAAKGQGEALAEILTGVRAEYVYPSYAPALKITGLNLTPILAIH